MKFFAKGVQAVKCLDLGYSWHSEVLPLDEYSLVA